MVTKYGEPHPRGAADFTKHAPSTLAPSSGQMTYTIIISNTKQKSFRPGRMIV